VEEKKFLKNHPIITLGGDKTWYPYLYKKKDGTLEGLDVDILNKINTITGANFKIKATSWTQALQETKEKKIDGLTTSIVHEERKDHLIFSDVYLPIKEYILVKKKDIHNIKTIDDLQNKTIAIQKGNLNQEKIVRNSFNSKIIFKDTLEEVYREVIYGKADATILVTSQEYSSDGYNIPYLDKAFSLKTDNGLVFSIRKDWPEALSILNKGLNTLSKKEKKRIQKKWNKNKSYITHNFGLNLSQNEINYLKKRKNIQICTSNSWNYEGNTAINKIALQLTDLILDKINLNSILIETPQWEDSLDYIKEKKCEVIPIMHPTEERMKYISFTPTIITYPIVLLTRSDVHNLYDLKILQNKKIAVISKNAVKDIFDKEFPNNQFIYFPNVKEAISALKKNQVFGYVDALPLTMSLFKNNKNKDIKINRFLNIGIEIAIGVQKDDQYLLSIINKSLDTLTSKEKDEFLTDPFFMSEKNNINFKIVLQVVAIFIAIIIIISYWNFQLKRGIKKALINNRKQESLLYTYAKQDAMKDLVGNISHQWKQPVNELSSVLFYIETKIQLRQKVTQSDIKDSTIQAREIINYLSKTVSTFSNFYDINTSQNEISILTLIQQAQFITEGSFQEHNIKVLIENQDPSLKIKGEDLQQVILAIFNNIKNIVVERKISQAQITIKLYKISKHIVLNIHDNCGGLNIDKKSIFQIGTSNTKNGTGLGLYISKRIIEDKYSGTITVENLYDGAFFIIKIPDETIK